MLPVVHLPSYVIFLHWNNFCLCVEEYIVTFRSAVRWRGWPLVVWYLLDLQLHTLRLSWCLLWTVVVCEVHRKDFLRSYVFHWKYRADIFCCYVPWTASSGAYWTWLPSIFGTLVGGGLYIMYYVWCRLFRFCSRCAMDRRRRWLGIYEHCTWWWDFLAFSWNFWSYWTRVEGIPLELCITAVCFSCDLIPVDLVTEALLPGKSVTVGGVLNCADGCNLFWSSRPLFSAAQEGT